MKTLICIFILSLTLVKVHVLQKQNHRAEHGYQYGSGEPEGYEGHEHGHREHEENEHGRREPEEHEHGH